MYVCILFPRTYKPEQKMKKHQRVIRLLWDLCRANEPALKK